jgi:hypothetical protein
VSGLLLAFVVIQVLVEEFEPKFFEFFGLSDFIEVAFEFDVLGFFVVRVVISICNFNLRGGFSTKS